MEWNQSDFGEVVVIPYDKDNLSEATLQASLYQSHHSFVRPPIVAIGVETSYC
jgi:hypothetical protein